MKRVIAKVGNFCKRNSSLLLTAASVSGVVISTVTAFKSGMKAQRKLDKLKNDPHVTKKEEVKTVAPEVAKTIIPSAITVTAIICLYLTDKKKQAALVSAVALFKNRYENFRDHFTDEELKEFDKQLEKEKFDTDDIFQTEIHRGEKILAYDTVSERYFYTSLEDLYDERYQINRYFCMTDIMSANMYFEFLGLPETDWGDGVGWESYIGETEYGYRWVDINIIEEELADGLIVYKIETPFGPHADYMNW